MTVWPGGVEIRGGDCKAGLFGGLPADLFHLSRVERENGGHGAQTGRNRQLHGCSARLHRAHGIGEADGPGSHVSAPFTKGVTGGYGRLNAMQSQHAQCGDARGEDGRLGVFRQLEVFRRPLEDQL